jgi:hypothetical protein
MKKIVLFFSVIITLAAQVPTYTGTIQIYGPSGSGGAGPTGPAGFFGPETAAHTVNWTANISAYPAGDCNSVITMNGSSLVVTLPLPGSCAAVRILNLNPSAANCPAASCVTLASSGGALINGTTSPSSTLALVGTGTPSANPYSWWSATATPDGLGWHIESANGPTGPQGLAGAGSTITVSNAASTGTTVNTLTKLTGAPSTAVIAATTDTGRIVGITSAGAGTTGSATIITIGAATCVFDGATTAGHYFQISTTVAGNCTDTGATFPTSGGQILGRVLSTNGSGGSYSVDLFSSEIQPSSGSGTSNWSVGFDFRSTSGYVIDGSCCVFVNAAVSYPTTTSINGNSITYGWETTPTGCSSNTSTLYDFRIAGQCAVANTAGGYTFRVNLPTSTATNYAISLGIGDANNGRISYVVIEDTTTPVLTLSAISTAGSAADIADAAGVHSAFNTCCKYWVADQTEVTASFSSGIARLVLGNSGSGNASSLVFFGLRRLP